MSDTPAVVLEAVFAVIQRNPNGASAAAIAQCLEPRPSDRKLRGWLSELIAAGQIVQRGEGTTALYCAIQPAVDQSAPVVTLDASAPAGPATTTSTEPAPTTVDPPVTPPPVPESPPEPSTSAPAAEVVSQSDPCPAAEAVAPVSAPIPPPAPVGDAAGAPAPVSSASVAEPSATAPTPSPEPAPIAPPVPPTAADSTSSVAPVVPPTASAPIHPPAQVPSRTLKPAAARSHSSPDPVPQPAADPLPSPTALSTADTTITGLANVVLNGIRKIVGERIARLIPGGSNPVFVAIYGAAFLVLGYYGLPYLRKYTGVLLAVAAAVVVGGPLVASIRKRWATRKKSMRAKPAASRRSTGKRVWVVAGGVAVVVIAVGAFWYLRTPPRPSSAVISAYLTSRLPPLPVRIASLTIDYGATDATGCSFTYNAKIETTAALFSRVDTVAYLRDRFTAELTAIEAANALVRGPDGDRLRTAIGGPSPTPAVNELMLLTVRTTRGTAAVVSDTLFAFTEGDQWVFREKPLPIDRSRLAGDPKPAGAAVFAVEYPEDAARLKALIADHAAYAGKIQAAAAALAAERAATRPTIEQRSDIRSQTSDAGVSKIESGTPVIGTSGTHATDSSHPDASSSASRDVGVSAFPNPTSSAVGRPSSGPSGTPALGSSGTPAGSAPISASQNVGISAFPSAPGAYVLSGSQWRTLPRNNGRMQQSTAQRLTMTLGKIKAWEDSVAGKPVDTESFAVATLVFDGRDSVPVVSAQTLVVAFVGVTPTAPAADVAKYPQLQTYPSIEIAPLKQQPAGARTASLVLIAPGYVGFGPVRLDLKLEQPRPGVMVLSRRGPDLPEAGFLMPGRYGLSCGAQSYELELN